MESSAGPKLPAPPPRLTPEPADFRAPETVTAAYLAAWCWLPLDKPANTNLETAGAWMTAAGRADDQRRAVSYGTWARIQQEQITTLCGKVTTTVDPRTAGYDPASQRFVEVRAERYRVGPDGKLLSTDTVIRMHKVLLQRDGRWLVDTLQEAG